MDYELLRVSIHDRESFDLVRKETLSYILRQGRVLSRKSSEKFPNRWAEQGEEFATVITPDSFYSYYVEPSRRVTSPHYLTKLLTSGKRSDERKAEILVGADNSKILSERVRDLPHLDRLKEIGLEQAENEE
jgi:hypothetical protein